MAQYFKECGHNKGWALNLRDSGKLHVYCFGCIIQKLGLTDYNADSTAKDAELADKIAKANQIKNKEVKK